MNALITLVPEPENLQEDFRRFPICPAYRAILGDLLPAIELDNVCWLSCGNDELLFLVTYTDRYRFYLAHLDSGECLGITQYPDMRGVRSVFRSTDIAPRLSHAHQRKIERALRAGQCAPAWWHEMEAEPRGTITFISAWQAAQDRDSDDRLGAGHSYLMEVHSDRISVQDAFKAFGWDENGNELDSRIS